MHECTLRQQRVGDAASQLPVRACKAGPRRCHGAVGLPACPSAGWFSAGTRLSRRCVGGGATCGLPRRDADAIAGYTAAPIGWASSALSPPASHCPAPLLRAVQRGGRGIIASARPHTAQSCLQRCAPILRGGLCWFCADQAGGGGCRRWPRIEAYPPAPPPPPPLSTAAPAASLKSPAVPPCP